MTISGWEIALIMVAFTYMMVNTVAVILQVKMLNKMDGLLTKSYKLMEKMIDKSEKVINDLFDDL